MCAITDGSPPSIDLRRRLELCPSPLPRQAYHAIVHDGLDLKVGERLIRQVAEASVKSARSAMRATKDLVAIAVVAEPRDLPDLERILKSHALLHSAEGDMYREVIVDAAEREGIPAFHFSSSELRADPQDALMKAFGASVGTPWQQEHKDAARAALRALASVPATARAPRSRAAAR
jgi:hypothetical protein